MSTESLLQFLNGFVEDLDVPELSQKKRQQYNLETHTFSYKEQTFLDEMLGDLASRKIILTQKRRDEIGRLAGIFSNDLYTKIKEIDTANRNKSIQRFKGSKTNFVFVFTTDVATGVKQTSYSGGADDNFDKIKQAYGDAYRRFFFGVKNTFEKKSAGRKKFNQAYKFRDDLEDVQSKGKMGHAGHAEGKGVVETMTREFFDKHAKTVFNKKNPQEKLTEEQLLKDLETLGIDISFMRDTMGLVQEISLIGAKGNIKAGQIIRQKLADAEKRMKQLIANPKLIDEMANDLEGSDSFGEIVRKKAVKKIKQELVKSKIATIKFENDSIKHSKKKLSKKGRMSGKSKGRVGGAIAVGGLASLKQGKRAQSRNSGSLIHLMALLNAKLPQTVAKNMGPPRLENRTGKFASSTRVVDVQQTPKGFPSIGYTYEKNPYSVFESTSGTRFASTNRDPRDLIDLSIREIAQEMAIGRFYTRRV